MSHPVHISGAKVAASVQAANREEILELLATLMEARPDKAAIREIARRQPDKWLVSVVKLGRLAGYTKKLQIEASNWLDIARLSDAQLVAELDKIRDTKSTR